MDMTTVTNPASQPTAAQAILQDTRALRRDVATILKLAQATALPMDGEERSFLDAVTSLLQMIVAGIEQNRTAIEALHQKLDEPGIASALRRMMDAD
jgi:hypothetical protein